MNIQSYEKFELEESKNVFPVPPILQTLSAYKQWNDWSIFDIYISKCSEEMSCARIYEVQNINIFFYLFAIYTKILYARNAKKKKNKYSKYFDFFFL